MKFKKALITLATIVTLSTPVYATNQTVHNPIKNKKISTEGIKGYMTFDQNETYQDTNHDGIADVRTSSQDTDNDGIDDMKIVCYDSDFDRFFETKMVYQKPNLNNRFGLIATYKDTNVDEKTDLKTIDYDLNYDGFPEIREVFEKYNFNGRPTLITYSKDTTGDEKYDLKMIHENPDLEGNYQMLTILQRIKNGIAPIKEVRQNPDKDGNYCLISTHLNPDSKGNYHTTFKKHYKYKKKENESFEAIMTKQEISGEMYKEGYKKFDSTAIFKYNKEGIEKAVSVDRIIYNKEGNKIAETKEDYAMLRQDSYHIKTFNLNGKIKQKKESQINRKSGKITFERTIDWIYLVQHNQVFKINRYDQFGDGQIEFVDVERIQYGSLNELESQDHLPSNHELVQNLLNPSNELLNNLSNPSEEFKGYLLNL